MNRADVISMARKSGAVFDQRYIGEVAFISKDALERFAALVAAAERGRCAKLTDDEFGDLTVLDDGFYNQLGDAEKTAQNIAKAIRALGGE